MSAAPSTRSVWQVRTLSLTVCVQVDGRCETSCFHGRLPGQSERKISGSHCKVKEVQRDCGVVIKTVNINVDPIFGFWYRVEVRCVADVYDLFVHHKSHVV
jgi:hypothetical protein